MVFEALDNHNPDVRSLHYVNSHNHDDNHHSPDDDDGDGDDADHGPHDVHDD